LTTYKTIAVSLLTLGLVPFKILDNLIRIYKGIVTFMRFAVKLRVAESLSLSVSGKAKGLHIRLRRPQYTAVFLYFSPRNTVEQVS
jgi:hypothetical protein